MEKFNLPFNFSYEEIEEFDFNFPDGVYSGFITSAMMKTPKSGGEQYCALEIQILDSNRKYFANFAVNNEKLQVRNIARKLIANLCKICEFEDPRKIAPKDFVGKLVGFQLKTSAKDGKQYLQKFVTPTEQTALADDEIRFF